MLRYTGHPLVDVGVATILAYCEKTDPAEITDADLQKVADFIERNYTIQPLQSFLTVAFGGTSGFTQPAYKDFPEKRIAYARKVAKEYATQSQGMTDICAFMGIPISGVSWSLNDKDPLPAGRAFREHIPLLNGHGVFNFLSSGSVQGLPVSGLAMLCIQFAPMGCAKCGGRLLAVHSDNIELMQRFAWRFFKANERSMNEAQAAEDSEIGKKMREADHSAQTLLIKTLQEVEDDRQAAHRNEQSASVTAYHFSNSGQTNPLDTRSPPLSIYYLPLQITDFLAIANTPPYRQKWQEIAHRAWQRPPTPKKGNVTPSNTLFVPRYNRLYEDVSTLSDGVFTDMDKTARFIRTYFLRVPRKNFPSDDPTTQYSLTNEAMLVSWELVALFLRKVIRMNDTRINEMRDLGDRLAEYVQQLGDKRFFRDFFKTTRDYDFRLALIKANTQAVRAGMEPLIRYKPYVTIFFEDGSLPGEELLRTDWRLMRDLVYIRMVEQLYENGWIGKNPDVITEEASSEESVVA